jgi:hypothetical protein
MDCSASILLAIFCGVGAVLRKRRQDPSTLLRTSVGATNSSV